MKRIFIIILVFSFGFTALKAQSLLATDPVNVVSIYPNPASEVLRLKIENSNLEKPSIQLRSILGNEVKATITRIEKNEWKIDIDDLANGYYFIVIKSADYNKAYKFLKK